MNKTFYTIIACLACILYYTFVHEGEQQEEIASPVAECEQTISHPEEASDAENVKHFEIPVTTKRREEILLEQYGYTVSYNPNLCIPNWVAWELNAEKMVVRESRNSKFYPNPKLPEDKAVTTQEYTGSGWDRGHMCPAGDN